MNQTTTPINSRLDIVISPVVLGEVMDLLGATPEDANQGVKVMVQEIIDRAKVFINRFSATDFLFVEPIHDFVGLEFRNKVTGYIEKQYNFRLILAPSSVGVFSTNEIPIDEMYDVRHLCAESSLPEFQ